ncbi:MAG TPA: hypothetical protein VN929_11705 [Burkholderiales bacterium]|nr:hypothetical protein [Burkholderiales bacterium]
MKTEKKVHKRRAPSVAASEPNFSGLRWPAAQASLSFRPPLALLRSFNQSVTNR